MLNVSRRSASRPTAPRRHGFTNTKINLGSHEHDTWWVHMRYKRILYINWEFSFVSEIFSYYETINVVLPEFHPWIIFILSSDSSLTFLFIKVSNCKRIREKISEISVSDYNKNFKNSAERLRTLVDKIGTRLKQRFHKVLFLF